MRNVKKWTDEEKSFVLNNYNTYSNKELGKILSRSEHSISSFLSKRFIIRSDIWSDDEINFLIKNYHLYHAHEISKFLDKTSNQIRWKARSLGLISKKTYINNIFVNLGICVKNARSSRLYETWASMKSRCNNPNKKLYKNYGGRGISVCEEWSQFINFAVWSSKSGYRDDLTIERIDVNGNYSPDNCTWIPRNKQCENKTDSVKITAWGETKILRDWSKDCRCKVTRSSIMYRLRSGMSPEDAISKPENNGKIFIVNGVSKSISEWSKDPICKVCYRTLMSRIRYGWEFYDALTIEVTK